MGRALPHGPSAAALWVLIRDHRSALEYDWRTRFGFGVSEVLSRRMLWREAWALTQQILRDPDSHTAASLAGWSAVPGAARVSAADLIEVYVGSKRKKNATPFRLDRPWTRGERQRTAGRITEEDRAQRARLDSLLFGQPPV